MPSHMNMNVESTKAIALPSKTIELLAAIQLLADSKHHGFAKGWAEQMYSKLSKDSLKMLSTVSQMCLQGMELVEFVLEYAIFDDVDELINKILEYEDILFLHKITGEQIGLKRIEILKKDREAFKKVVTEIPWLIREDTIALELAFYHTEDFKKKMVQLLTEVNNEIFTDKIGELREQYERAVEEMNIRILQEEIHALVQSAIGKKWPIKAHKEYFFVPSYFISPHHLMIYNYHSLIVVYDMTGNKAIKQEAGKDIADALSVISDKTRLEILRQIIAEPTYGKVLASMLNLTTATISYHLEQLKCGGLIKEHRVKNIKYFSANIEKIDILLEDIKDYLYNS